MFLFDRDKFLDGKPINSYDAHWINKTSSIQSWIDRWYIYWLPALISKGIVAPSEKFLRFLTWYLYLSELIVDRYEELPGYKSDFFKDATVEEKLVKYQGRLLFLFNSLQLGYTFVDPIKLFGNISFTFIDFLNHVLWTSKLGFVDHHWMTFTQICDPCRYKYKYILKLENIAEESRYLLQKVLGYPDEVTLPSVHRSKTVTNMKPDEEYFKDVPEVLINRIMNLYKTDVLLFDYKLNVV